jgi:hypothetical protein
MLGPLHGGCVVRYSNTSAHAMLGTSSIATVTTNTHSAKAASTFITTLFMTSPSFLEIGLIAPPSLVS